MRQLDTCADSLSDQSLLSSMSRSAAAKDDKQKEAVANDFGLVRVRQLDTSAIKAPQLTGIAAKIGVPPPAGFGLDFLPGGNPCI